MEVLKKLLPSDIEFTTTQDQSVKTDENLKDVEVSLIVGALLAVTIVFLFLHNLRGTMIVALSIPTSIIATFLVMYALGFTLNSMTLIGLSLAVGILVDDSIVVLENIYRHLALGETPEEAARNGRGEIGLAAVTNHSRRCRRVRPGGVHGRNRRAVLPELWNHGRRRDAVLASYELQPSHRCLPAGGTARVRMSRPTGASSGRSTGSTSVSKRAIVERFAGRSITGARFSLSATWPSFW